MYIKRVTLYDSEESVESLANNYQINQRKNSEKNALKKSHDSHRFCNIVTDVENWFLRLLRQVGSVIIIPDLMAYDIKRPVSIHPFKE